MQDKFAIGPVTFVQLVGLEAKPRIPSARADGAARAADHPPPSAAPGLGGKAQEPVSDIESSYFAIKATPTLGLSGDPLQAHIVVEAGVDRPDPNVSAPPPKFDPSNPDDPSDPDPANPPVDGRGGPTLNTPDAAGDDGNPSATPPVGATGSTESILADHVVFDGETEFGDDEILDFTLAVSDAYLAQNASGNSSVEGVGLDLGSHGMGDFAVLDIIDFSGGDLPDLDQFVDHVPSGTDAVLPI